jgi:hypothetical protein
VWVRWQSENGANFGLERRAVACVARVAEGQSYHFRRLFFVTFFWRPKESKESKKFDLFSPDLDPTLMCN